MGRSEYQRDWIQKKRDAERTSIHCIQCGAVIPHNPAGGNTKRICELCAPDNRFKALVRRYGVDKSMWEAMYFEQDGQCAISSCEREASVVDHDHVSGRVRGLVCQGCNVALGFVEDESWLQGAFNYLQGACT